jgi:hypothetical protein
MRQLIAWIAPLTAGLLISAPVRAEGAEPSAAYDPAVPLSPPSSPATEGAQPPPVPDAPGPNAGLTRVQQVAKKGFIFQPSIQDPGAFRAAVGAFYDAIDPAVMYGFNVRVPQVTVDMRWGLGQGWSIKAHVNSIFIINELLAGASYAWRGDNWSLEGTMTVGAYIGKFGQVGFDALLVSPEYRPELALGYDLGKIALTLRGSLMFMGPERVSVGDATGGLDNSNAFVGHSEMLFVENTTKSNGVWYFGVGAMTTRAYYALWLLFPDSPGLFTYPRIVAGYEF